MSLLLQASGLGYRYPDQIDPLFEGLELTLYAGEHVALLGANGDGKTTLLNLLSGALPLQTGDVIRHAVPATHMAMMDPAPLEHVGRALSAAMARL